MSTIPNDQSIDQNILNNYQVIAKLGSGAYGHVWKVIDKIDNKQYALKKVYSAFQNDLDAQRTFRQISILTKLNHTNIVKLNKIIKAKNDFDLYIVFQLVQSDLFKAIKGNILTSVHKKYIIYQIAKSLKFIHSAGLLHRDIKPSNILINSQCKIKLCDFGLSRTTFCYASMQPIITEFIATRWYRAPQVMLGSQSYTSKADIWSLGCLIYQMYAHKALLPGQDNIDQIQKLLQFKGFPNQEQKIALKINGIDKILGHFATQKKVLNEYFLKIEDIKLKKLLLKIFQYDPGKRPSAQQILEHSFLQELRNYQPEIISQNKLQLEQNQNIKLTASQYKKLIYDNFINKLQCTQNSSIKLIQSDKNFHRSIVERALKKKSSHLIKVPSNSILQPLIKKKQSFIKQKYIQQNQSDQFQRKKQFVSLYLKQNQQKEKQFFRQHKKQSSQLLNKAHQQVILDQSNYFQLKKQGVNKFKKRIIKQNSMHFQNKENQQNSIKEYQVSNFQKHQHKQDVKLAISFNNSPKKRLSVKKKGSNNQNSVSLSIPKKKVENQKRIQSIVISKQKISKLYPKQSISLHSSINQSLNHSRERLPQLIVKHRQKIVTNKLYEKKQSQFKILYDVSNIRYSEATTSPIQKEKSYINSNTKKLQKKGITKMCNKPVLMQN